MASTKVAISLPSRTFTRLEKKRRELKKSRSQLIAEAIEAWLDRETLSVEERRYIVGYLKHPDNGRVPAAIAAASAWDEWDET
ncbi:MAG: ribbon-helix-helix protein, CopG family [Kofleriaceae bacterium]